MHYFKFIMGVFILMSIFLPTVSQASNFTSPLGSPGNPIYGTLQIIETIKQKEDKLIATYGYSEYNSCRASACSSGDMSNPSSQENCLMQVEYSFRAGRCGRSGPNLTCQDGLIMQNGRCVKEQQTQTCPPNTVLENGSCMYYYPQTIETTLSESQICINDYGSQSIWTGERNEQGYVVCGCIDGYDFIDDSDTCKYVEQDIEWSQMQEQLDKVNSEIDLLQSAYAQNPATVSHPEESNKIPVDNDETCRSNYGSKSVWSSRFNEEGGIICRCIEGYGFIDETETCLPVPALTPVVLPVLLDKQNNPTSENNERCRDDYGEASTWSRELNSIGGPICDCVDGYVTDENRCLFVVQHGRIASFFKGLLKGLFGI